jgi:hypothetical protein
MLVKLIACYVVSAVQPILNDSIFANIITRSVANTHIYWDPEFDDVKLWQTRYFARLATMTVTVIKFIQFSLGMMFAP